MKRTSTSHTFALTVLICLCLCACSGVERIDLQNPAVPIESRRLIADAEDAVSIARARLDDANAAQVKIQRWARTLQDNSTWPSEGGANANLRKLSSARLQRAALGVDLARGELELAEAKYDLVTAETSIRHDLAIYELKPLRDRTQAARASTNAIAAQIEGLESQLDGLTGEWWQSYGGFVRGGGESHPFFTAFKATEPLIPVRRPASEKKEDDAKEKSDEKGKEKSKPSKKK